MSATKIPETTLAQLVCSECGRYLSVGPIRTRLDGRSVCGRCIHITDPDPSPPARNYIYEAVIYLHVFPCSNRHQGCPEYVSFNRVDEHELICIYRTYQCPVDLHGTCHWTGRYVQLLNHYQQDHPELYLTAPKPPLSIYNDYEVYYLLNIQGLLLLLQTKCITREARLLFSVVHLGPIDRAPSVTYEIKFSKDDEEPYLGIKETAALPDTKMKMNFNTSLEMDINGLLSILKHPDTIYCHWIFKTTSELDEELDGLKCPTCKIFMAPPIYECPIGHVTCEDCKGYENECKLCGKSNVTLTRVRRLEGLSESTVLPCRWKECGEILSCSEIRHHETDCSKRIYKCPFCTEWSGLLKTLPDHITHAHPDNTLYTDKLTLPGTYGYYYSACIITHGDVFEYRFFEPDNTGMLVKVWYHGPPSLVDNYSIELDLKHATLPDIPANKTFALAREINNTYKVTVPIRDINDINRFGWPSYYSYKIKIIKQITTAKST